MAAERDDDRSPTTTPRVDPRRAGATGAGSSRAGSSRAGSSRGDRAIAGVTNVLLIGASVGIALVVVLPAVFVVLALTLGTAVGDWTIPGAAVVAAAAAAGTVYGGVTLTRRLGGEPRPSRPSRAARPARVRHWPWSRP